MLSYIFSSSSNNKKNPEEKSIFPLLWIMLFDHASLNMTVPVLTLLFFDINSSFFPPDTSHAIRSMWYGMCIAVPHVVNIIATPILSALSDEFGRKIILIISTLGALAFALTTTCSIFFGSLSLLFLGYLIRGAFSRTNPIAQAIVGDISLKEKKILHMGYLQTAISLGALIGPILGGYLAKPLFYPHFNFSLPYLIAGITAAIGCLLTCSIFKETHLNKNINHSSKKLNLLAIKKLLSNSRVWYISILLLLSQVSWSTYYQFMPPILKTILNFNASHLGLFIGLIALWLALATSIGIKLLQCFFPLPRILMIAIYLILIGCLLSFLSCFAQFKGLLSNLVWLAAIPTAVGDVIAYSCLITLYSDVVTKFEQGKVMGICFITIAMSWTITSLLGGFLMSQYTLLPLLVAPIGALTALILLHSGFGKKIFDI